MKITRTLPDGVTTLETEAPSPKAVFERLALIDSHFGVATECGCCKSKRIYYNVRTVENGKYYEMKCHDCTATLSFGQSKDNLTLFCKTWDKENRCVLPDVGWSVYQGNRQSDDHHHSQPEPQQNRRPAPPPSQDSDVPFSFVWPMIGLLGMGLSMLA